jgi:adenosylmethionine-8-amino-7-oxononanoate aminotransferase
MTQTSGEQIKHTARDHYLFPLAPADEVREDGMMLYSHGEGATLTDVDGKEYLDAMGSGTRATSLGYGQEEIARAVYNQLVSLHYVGTVQNQADTVIRLAAKLAELAPGQLNVAFFVGSGSEANEAAFKLAKQYHYYRGNKPRAHKIISRWNAYHGATMGAQAATDWLGTRHISEPGVPGYSHIPAPTCYRCPFSLEYPTCNLLCAQYLEQQILHEGPEFVAAFIAEPVMQANGVQVPPPEYFPMVRDICKKYEVLFIGDEIITGFGRTGEWFALQHWEVEPDIMTIAKAMTSGYFPMGGLVTRPDITETLPAFLHVQTYNGHPAGAAAALANIGIYERNNLIARGKELGAYLLEQLKPLERHPSVGQVRGLGMWLAVDFTADKATKAPFTDDTVKAIARRAHDLGVLVGTIGTAIEIAPVLTSTRDELDRMASVLDQAIGDIEKERNIQ